MLCYFGEECVKAEIKKELRSAAVDHVGVYVCSGCMDADEQTHLKNKRKKTR